MTKPKGPGPTGPGASKRKAAARATKGSVQEAIGKLIGDDAVRDRGRAEKQAGTVAADRPTPPRD